MRTVQLMLCGKFEEKKKKKHQGYTVILLYLTRALIQYCQVIVCFIFGVIKSASGKKCCKLVIAFLITEHHFDNSINLQRTDHLSTSSKPLSRAVRLMHAQPERERERGRGRTKGGLETEEERRCERGLHRTTKSSCRRWQ